LVKQARRRYRYLLGDSRKESARLAAQARLWDPIAHQLFDRLGVRPGWRVLEVGPGPGTLHRELRRRLQGPADAVERSPAFAAGLARAAARDRLGAGTVWSCDLAEAPLSRGHYDLIFARWVFLFLPDPEAHLRQLVRALKPGGLLAIEDYFRESLALLPLPAEWPPFMAADRAFFASQGGDINIGARLPALYRQVGLEVIEVTPTIKSGHPGSPVWRWLSTYFLGIMDRYARLAPFSPAQAQRLVRQWRAAARHSTSVLLSPTVVDVVGRKVRGRS
jgi:SAM-dependent methyltransferase